MMRFRHDFMSPKPTVRKTKAKVYVLLLAAMALQLSLQRLTQHLFEGSATTKAA